VPDTVALNKEFKKIISLPSSRHGGTRQRVFLKKLKKSLPSVGQAGTRQSRRHRSQRRDNYFSLPSAEEPAVGKACRQG
jgi:hypothetical protein